MPLEKTLLFSTGATVEVQWEDMGHWMNRVIAEANGKDHRGHSYSIWVMKTGRLITHNTKPRQHHHITRTVLA